MNCGSEAVSINPDGRVFAWMEAVDERTLFLSALTLGEIRKGVVTLVGSKRRAHLESWLEMNRRRRFDGSSLPIDAAVSDRRGLLFGEIKRKGKPMPVEPWFSSRGT